MTFDGINGASYDAWKLDAPDYLDDYEETESDVQMTTCTQCQVAEIADDAPDLTCEFCSRENRKRVDEIMSCVDSLKAALTRINETQLESLELIGLDGDPNSLTDDEITRIDKEIADVVVDALARFRNTLKLI